MNFQLQLINILILFNFTLIQKFLEAFSYYNVLILKIIYNNKNINLFHLRYEINFYICIFDIITMINTDLLLRYISSILKHFVYIREVLVFNIYKMLHYIYINIIH